jgi:hypothetical protein
MNDELKFGEIKVLAEPAGSYRIGNGYHTVTFSLSNKPKLIHRLFCKFFLGWEWEDSIESKNKKHKLK